MRKSNKAKRADKLRTQHAKAAAYSQEIKARPATWSARMPAYCYTELCPDPALRRAPGRRGWKCQRQWKCSGRRSGLSVRGVNGEYEAGFKVSGQ